MKTTQHRHTTALRGSAALAALATLAVLSPASSAAGQELAATRAHLRERVLHARAAFPAPGCAAGSLPAAAPSRRLRDSVSAVDFGALLESAPQPAPAAQPAPPRRRSLARKIVGSALGGVGGLFAGGYLGAKIDGDCGGCDDPGLIGALIGAPIGAATGAILGYKFF